MGRLVCGRMATSFAVFCIILELKLHVHIEKVQYMICILLPEKHWIMVLMDRFAKYDVKYTTMERQIIKYEIEKHNNK